jgi:hypothetical protein
MDMMPELEYELLDYLNSLDSDHAIGFMGCYKAIRKHIPELDAMDYPEARKHIRQVCRELRDRGFAMYQNGLMNDDYEMVGAGYGLTEAGREYWRSLDRASRYPWW